MISLISEMIYHDLVYHHHIASPEYWLRWKECDCKWSAYLRGKMSELEADDELETQRKLGAASTGMTQEQFNEIFVSVRNQWREKSLDEKIARIRELTEAVRILQVHKQAVYAEYEEEVGELPEELRRKVALKGPTAADKNEKLITDLMAMMQCDRETAAAILKGQGKVE